MLATDVITSAVTLLYRAIYYFFIHSALTQQEKKKEMSEDQNAPKDRIDKALDELDNWYDNALKSGGGFKSDEERRQYLESLGDLEKHPMFAQTTEDLEGNPLTEALRAIREEDKTNIELAIMYKDEGNEWIKKTQDRKKALYEAFDRYSHAIKFMEKEIGVKLNQKEATETGDDKKASSTIFTRSILYENVQLLAPEHQQLLSQCYSNRAAASFSLSNYGQCKNDCNIALSVWSNNSKALLRKIKSLFALHNYQECMQTCSTAFETLIQLVDSLENNEKKTSIRKEIEEIHSFQLKCEDTLQKNAAKLKAAHQAQWTELKRKYLTIYSLAQCLPVKLAYFPFQHREPLQLKDCWLQHETADLQPFLPVNHLKMKHFPIETELPHCSVPLVCLYPQYNQFDIIPDANLVTMIVEYLAMIFPEPEDAETIQQNKHPDEPQQQPIPWDVNKEYKISNLVVYLSVVGGETAKETLLTNNSPNNNPMDWLISCLEYNFVYLNNSVEFFRYALNEILSDPTLEEFIEEPKMNKSNVSEGNRKNLSPHYQEYYFNEQRLNELTAEDIQKVIQTTEETVVQKTTPSKDTKSKQMYIEIHLGCSLYQIVQEVSKYQGLSRGVLSLIVFPKSSQAHKTFLEKNKKEGIAIQVLSPR
jgi:hypothetical protein